MPINSPNWRTSFTTTTYNTSNTTVTFQEPDAFYYNSEQLSDMYRWILKQPIFSKKDRVTKLGNKID